VPLFHAYNKTAGALLRASVIMRFLALIFSFATILVSGVSSARNPSSANCVAFAEAAKHVGTTQCIRGTVLRVEDGRDGMKFLNFCNDHQTCPFTVVVFPADLKKMGDIHQLEGRQVEVKGTVQDHDGRTEIVLRRSQQLGESAFQLFPSVPTDYDVERRGHASAGKYSRPKARKTHKKQGAPVSIEDPEEPQ